MLLFMSESGQLLDPDRYTRATHLMLARRPQTPKRPGRTTRAPGGCCRPLGPVEHQANYLKRSAQPGVLHDNDRDDHGQPHVVASHSQLPL
jgi:hypothetical protein